MSTDRFGNVIDPQVGYARGRHLASSADEIRRLRHAQEVTKQVAAERGIDGISIFTGNPRYFPLRPEDLVQYCEEWIGPGLFADELAAVARDHLGGKTDDAVAVTNRTSAAIIAAVLALSDNRSVVAVVPDGDRSHPSLIRACALAGVPLREVGINQYPEEVIARQKPALVVITLVTSALARMSDSSCMTVVGAAKREEATVFLDEAYGARLRPVLYNGRKSLQLGADLAVTNTDKAGLGGPRAGVLVGARGPVLATLARASELGQEARAPIALGALRSLQHYNPEDLLLEAREGSDIAEALRARFGDNVVHRSDLGPSISEEDILALLLARSKGGTTSMVPAEASAALGMLMLRDFGVLTVNTHGAPGGRVSIRLKPTRGALQAVGGAERLVDGVASMLDKIATHMNDDVWLRATLFGTH